MHPILFTIDIPEFLQGIFPANITVYGYGMMIALGAVLAITYTGYHTKRLYGLKYEDANTLFLSLFISAYIGGKVFYLFEDPSYYLSHLGELMSGRGFVFYGSFLFTMPVLYWFIKSHRLPLWGMLDIIAMTTCIVHFFGRIGCFLAGCCHGLPWDGAWSVSFDHPACLASPLGTPLHPTQLYSAFLLLAIIILLLIISKRQVFSGQVFLSYLILYAIGRSVIEVFRGDISRGYVIENYVSHSQFISLIIVVIALLGYYKLYRHSRKR